MGNIYSAIIPYSLCSKSSHQFYAFWLILRNSFISVLNEIVPWVALKLRWSIFPNSTNIISALLFKRDLPMPHIFFPPWQSQGFNVLATTMSANSLIVQQYQFSFLFLCNNLILSHICTTSIYLPFSPTFLTLINPTSWTHLHSPSYLHTFLVDFHFLLQVMDEPTVFVFDPQQEGNRVVAFVKPICISVIRLELNIRVCWYSFW